MYDSLLLKTLSFHKDNNHTMSIHTVNGVRLTGKLLDFSLDDRLIRIGNSEEDAITVNLDNVTSYSGKVVDDYSTMDKDCDRYFKHKRNTY